MDSEPGRPAYEDSERAKEFWSGGGGEVDECSLLLRFFGDDLNPDLISSLLGVPATEAYRKGDQVSKPSGAYTVPTGQWLLQCEETTDSADHQVSLLLADLTNDLNGGIAHPLILAIGKSLCRRDSHGISGMNAHRIKILDRADDDDVVLQVAHHLEFVFLPAEYRLFNQNFVNRAQIESPLDDFFVLFVVVCDSSARSAQRE